MQSTTCNASHLKSPTVSPSVFAIVITSSIALAVAASCTTYHFHPHRPPWVTGVVDLPSHQRRLCTILHNRSTSPHSPPRTRCGRGRLCTNVGCKFFPWRTHSTLQYLLAWSLSTYGAPFTFRPLPNGMGRHGTGIADRSVSRLPQSHVLGVHKGWLDAPNRLTG